MALPGYFTVTIYTKPYLKKYLETLYGNPLIFTLNNYFGITVAGLLDNPVEFHDNKEGLRRRVDKFDCKMQIHCPRTFLTKRRFGFFISDFHIISLNKMYEKRFEEDLWRFCMIHNIAKIETRTAIEEFCKAFGIEIDEDITMDALVKKEYRYNKSLYDNAPDSSTKKVRVIQPTFF